MDDRSFFLLATVAYALGVGTLFGNLDQQGKTLHRLRYTFIASGFLLQSVFLFLRSVRLGHCPLTNLFESFAFITWTIVLLYLVIGKTYRLSVLGLFSSPLVVILNLFAFLAPIDGPSSMVRSKGFWAELHAPLAVMSYGAFAMAAATGCMFLVQQRLLKSHRLTTWFYALPSVAETDRMTLRLLLFGLVVYSVGLAAGFAAGVVRGAEVFDFKTLWSLVIWVAYVALYAARRTRKLGSVQGATVTIGLFAVVILTFWGAYLLSPLHQ